MTLDMQARAVRKVEECKALAIRAGIKIDREVEVRFDLKGPSTMGQAKTESGKLVMRLHPDMIEAHGDEYLEDVVPHEFAHLLMFATGAYAIDTPHGKTWKGFARAVGCPNPKSTTNLSLPANLTAKKRKATHAYKCGCAGKVHNLSTIRHNKVRRGQTNYTCKRCGEIVKPA